MDHELVTLIARQMNSLQYPFPKFAITMKNDEPCLLGRGGFSVILDAYNRDYPDEHYALKIIDDMHGGISVRKLRETCRIQRMLSEESSHVVRIIDYKSFVVRVKDHTIFNISETDHELVVSDNEFVIHCVLMEKLMPLIQTDKFHVTRLTHTSLQNREEIYKFATEIGEAISTAHAEYVIHRDIKLENMFWDAKAQCYKIGDFGVAKMLLDQNAETIVFSDGYGAPEISRMSGKSYSYTVDIYSFGITLYLLLNDLKFPGSDCYQPSRSQYLSDYIFPDPQNADRETADVIKKMCSYHARDRFQSMDEAMQSFIHAHSSKTIKESEPLNYYMKTTETFVITEEPQEESQESHAQGIMDLEFTFEESRMKRMERIRDENSDYRGDLFYKYIAITILFMATLFYLQPQSSYKNISFFILALSLLVLGVARVMKEFDIVMTMIVLLINAYIISKSGLSYIPFIFFIILLFYHPVIYFSCASGIIAWIFLGFKHTSFKYSLISTYHLSWIFIALMILEMLSVLKKYLKFSHAHSQIRMYLKFIVNRINVAALIISVVLMILDWRKIIVMPSFIRPIHLFFIAIVLCIFNKKFFEQDDYLLLLSWKPEEECTTYE